MFRNEEDDDLLTLVDENLDDEVSVLLESGAEVDINKVDCDGNTALHLAVLEASFEMAYQLVMRGADISKKNNNGQTPLHMAAKQDDLSMLKCLLERQGEGSCRKALARKDNHNDTPLHIAASKNDLEMTAYLLEKGAGVLAVNDKGETALELAILNRNINAVKELVRKNSDCLHVQNLHGYPPLHQAVILERYEMVEWLLDYAGANLFEESSHYNVTALTLAAKSSNKTMAGLLLSRGAGIKADLTDVNLAPLDLKNYVLIGAEDNGAPIQCEGIKTASELHEAKLKGVGLDYRALCRAITARLIGDPENKELLRAQATVKSSSKGLAGRYAVRPIPPRYIPEEVPCITSISCKRT